MMITTPSAPGGAGAAPTTLPGVAPSGNAFAPSATGTAGAPDVATAETAEGSAPAPLFAQLLDFAGLALPAGTGGTTGTGLAGQAADSEAATEETPADMPLAAMMPSLHFAILPAAQPQAAAAFAPERSLLAGNGLRGATLLAGAADSARQAAADAITAATAAAGSPLAARLMQGTLPATGETEPKAGVEARQPSATAAGTGTTAQAGANAVLATQDGAAQSGQDGQSGQSGQSQGDAPGTFRGVMAGAPLAGPADGMASADTVKLAGNPDQWQQPLRAALGDRLQVTLQNGGNQAANQAVIRLEPPNLGTIEISIRQSAGALHVSMSATHGEVVRQLNAVGDSMRQDLSQRQGGDVAVTVTQTPSRSLADGQAGGRQGERDAEQREQRGPGRALSDGDDTNTTTFAMARE